MKLSRETEQYYIGEAENGEALPEEYAAVRINAASGARELWFDKTMYRDWQECRQRVERRSREKQHDGAARIVKTFQVLSKSVAIADEDWEAMKKFMVSPERFEKEDFRVYDAWLCHNFVDRDQERFSMGVLQSFQKTIVGKALLTGHNWEGAGDGRYFKARLEQVSVDEAVKLAGPHPGKELRAQLELIEKRDGGLYWLVASYYMLADDVARIRRIDSGIISDMSIGFRAPKLEAVKAEDNERVLWWEYRNSDNREAEALEGSHVFLGSQYGARTRKDAVLLSAGMEEGEKIPADPEKAQHEIAELANRYRQSLVEEVVKYGCLAGIIAADAKSVQEQRARFGQLTVQELSERINEYKAIYKQRHPKPELLSDNLEEKIRTIPVPVPRSGRYYRAPVLG